METVTAVMSEWTLKFIKHMDILRRDVIEIQDSSNMIEVKKKSLNETYLLRPTLDKFDEIISHTKPKSCLVVVTLNSLQNLRVIIENWHIISKYENFKIIFINPYSKTDKKWILKPHFHNKISEQSALKTGLRTIFESVESIDEKAFKKILEA